MNKSFVASISAKKHLGQHFLKDENIAERIVDSLKPEGRYKEVLEIGPGMGILSQFLFERKEFNTTLIEIDKEAISYLKKHFPDRASKIIEGDFLSMNLMEVFKEQFAIIGNFPYNISSQILFKTLENKEMIPEVVGMFQKEVAERIASEPGNKEYGILSVLMQAFYNVELLFVLDENDFSPPPKVKSAVIGFERKENFTLGTAEKTFFRVVKTAFNQRRKMLRNSLSPLMNSNNLASIPYLDKRAEALSWQQFVELTNSLEHVKHGQ
jgi:16S rRNA (adenine1518-N6/adenine1519-N6)-dimethyltransferase